MYRLNGAAICCTACSPRKDPLRLSPLLQAPPEQVLEAVRKLGLEGVIGKRMNSVYEPGERSGAWIKLRTNLEQEFVIGGYIPAHADSMRCSSASMRKRPHLRRECENGFVPRIRDEIFPALKALQTASHDKCGTANVSY